VQKKKTYCIIRGSLVETLSFVAEWSSAEDSSNSDRRCIAGYSRRRLPSPEEGETA